MIVIFKFEKIWYAKKNIAVEYVGHPFLDIWKKKLTEKQIKLLEDALEKLNKNESRYKNRRDSRIFTPQIPYATCG